MVHSSAVFRDFAHEMDFTHVTSSPHNPQGNGHADRAVQTAKRILRQKDPLLALMIYRSSPHSSTGVSPVELLMGRKIRTILPTLAKVLQPKWPNQQHIRAKDAVEKSKQAFHYNKRYDLKPLTPLQPGGPVLTRLDNQKTWSTPAEMAGEHTTERSYSMSSLQSKEPCTGKTIAISKHCLMWGPQSNTLQNQIHQILRQALDVALLVQM